MFSKNIELVILYKIPLDIAILEPGRNINWGIVRQILKNIILEYFIRSKNNLYYYIKLKALF